MSPPSRRIDPFRKGRHRAPWAFFMPRTRQRAQLSSWETDTPQSIEVSWEELGEVSLPADQLFSDICSVPG